MQCTCLRIATSSSTQTGADHQVRSRAQRSDDCADEERPPPGFSSDAGQPHTLVGVPARGDGTAPPPARRGGAAAVGEKGVKSNLRRELEAVRDGLLKDMRMLQVSLMIP